ncbi:MAG: CBS domain-containing protein, partial [Candidatus Hydrogenedentota bacterium]
MSNAKSFLGAFSSIEKWLRSETGLDRKARFSQLVDRASDKNFSVRQFSIDLKEFADLRNAIVHERTDGHIIAEPNAGAVRDIQEIESKLLAPPLVIPKFRCKVEVADYSSPLATVVSRMSRRKFSQLPVVRDSQFEGVLTTNTIARWLGLHPKDGMALLNDTPVGEVLKHSEFKDNYKFVGRSATLFEVLDEFDKFERQGRLLDAVLITEHGKSTIAFLGIITLYDMPEILRQVERKRG